LSGNADSAQQGWIIAINAVAITRLSMNFDERNEGFMTKNVK